MPEAKTFQGTPCKRGHSGLRFLINHTCVECTRLKNQEQAVARASYLRWWRSENREQSRKQSREGSKRWRARNPLKVAKTQRHTLAVQRNTLDILREDGWAL